MALSWRGDSADLVAASDLDAGELLERRRRRPSTGERAPAQRAGEEARREGPAAVSAHPDSIECPSTYRSDPATLIGAGDPAEFVAAADLDAADILRWRLTRVRARWTLHAECATTENVDVDFFATTKAGVATALALCTRCPVVLACRQWALDPALPLTDGVAGGMTAAARRLAYPRRRKARS